MPKLIDNTQLFDQAHLLTASASQFLERLERDVVQDTPEKVQTVAMIKLIIEAQSEAIRRLVEQHAEICDRLNLIIPKLPD